MIDILITSAALIWFSLAVVLFIGDKQFGSSIITGSKREQIIRNYPWLTWLWLSCAAILAMGIFVSAVNKSGVAGQLFLASGGFLIFFASVGWVFKKHYKRCNYVIYSCLIYMGLFIIFHHH